VYLHNNQLSNAGLPPDAFQGSEAVTTLSLSSNRLTYLPPSLPASLERLHLQVPCISSASSLSPSEPGPPFCPVGPLCLLPSILPTHPSARKYFSLSFFVAQAGLKLVILQAQPPECWDYRRAP
jgi:hypothetical protein